MPLIVIFPRAALKLAHINSHGPFAIGSLDANAVNVSVCFYGE
jgi:hypothetical protein